MTRSQRYLAIGVASVVAVLVFVTVLWRTGVFDYDVWKREHPLVSAIAVTSVRDGTITLADGRAFRPAGVRRHDGVSIDEFDKAVSVVVAQGVFVVREVGDGSAFLVAEPKFYNWCGTRNMDGVPWKRWAGSYLQCPVSELLIQMGYATADLEQVGLTAREQWRLEGVEQIAGFAESPTRVSDQLSAFRYGGSEKFFVDYDATLELVWRPPPSR